MMNQNKYNGVDSYVVNQVRYHARKLVRHQHIHSMEVEDIEQQLMLDVLYRTKAYNSDKASWHTFVDRIIRHKIANLIEDARALKRGGGVQQMSLDALLENKGGEDGLFSDQSVESMETMHLSIDLKRVMQALPRPLVSLLMQLQEYNPSEISRMTDVPRSTLYGSINILRETFSQYGMDGYLS